ncbi:MerC domain-containing protein [Thioalkalivibrio nitratireducens]|uniref:MerC domain-containing protein n=1 Tax=Thioalkalivibrio nitratireducens TaxID=186931 RepID=UPI0014702905|nr:MerC domain-containing protein [Thioalkalivibrio nitratireducens]
MTILVSETLQRRPWDLAGIGASTLCVLHCLVTPALVVFLPVLGALEEPTHALLALAILGIGLLAFWPGYLRHRRWQVVATAIAGFVLISLGVTTPDGLLSESAEIIATVAGGVVLVAAHSANAYFCRYCRHCGENGCTTS